MGTKRQTFPWTENEKRIKNTRIIGSNGNKESYSRVASVIYLFASITSETERREQSNDVFTKTDISVLGDYATLALKIIFGDWCFN